jgi:hypothetical protein
MTFMIENILSDPLSKNSPPADGQPGTTDISANAIAVVIYYMEDAASISAQGAMVRAKQLNQNGVAQQQLNDRAAKLQLFDVPQLQVDHHKQMKQNEHTKMLGRGARMIYYTYKTIAEWDTNPNIGAVNNAEAQNQQVAGERQIISDRLSVLQQDAQTAATNINSLSDESMQSTQAATNLIQVLQDLTFKALLRKPPQV